MFEIALFTLCVAFFRLKSCFDFYRKLGSYKKSQPFCQDFSRTKLNFQGPPTKNVISQMVYKCTFPVQANRFLRLQVFALSPLHFSVDLSFLFISCFHTRVLQCLELLYTGKNTKVYAKQFAFDPTTLKLKKIQGLFKALHRNSRTFQGQVRCH